MSVQEKTQGSLPRLEFLFGKRLEEFAADYQFSFQTARLALPLFGAQGFQANERLVATRDDDFFALASLFNKAGKVRLGVMDLYCRHVS